MSARDTPIRDSAVLAERVAAWPSAGPLALDTEFMRERTYYPKLCLIQIAAGDEIALVDALEIGEAGALLPLLRDAGRPKQLHAARQDIEALLPLVGAPIVPVFDTQQAASLLGFPAQVGYAVLVRQLLGVELAKGHARTDWSRRPLSDEQIRYAVDDVRHLPALVDVLERRLDTAGRRAWLEEESAALRSLALYRIEPAEAWRRLKGIERLDPPAFAVARALAEWRERRAMARDLPRGWILPDIAIAVLAEKRPTTRAALAQIAVVPRGAVTHAGNEIVGVIASVTADPAARDAADVPRPGLEELRRQKVLQQRLAAIATDLGIQPEVLATRRELAALARGHTRLPVLSGWRRTVVGEPLLAAL